MIIAALILVNVGLLYGYLKKDAKKPKFDRPTDEQRMQMTKTRLQEDVGFTDAQAEQYIQLRKNHFESIRPMFEDLRVAKDSLFSLSYRDDSDTLVDLYAKRVCDKQTAIDTRMVNYFRSLRALANEDQKTKMDTFLMNMTRRMAGGAGGPGGHRGGKERK